MKPIELLFERAGLPYFGLPAVLAVSYGGDFGLTRPGLYANFVSSVDGVVALAGAGESGAVVSGHSQPERFGMGLLRACADAVLIGAGTFRNAPGGHWHAEDAYPEAAEHFADLRRQLGLRRHPRLVLVTASGRLDGSHPALQDSLIVTTRDGAATLRGSLPAGARVVTLAPKSITGRDLMALLDAEKLSTVLTEGGPSLMGQLVQEGLVDELFLTTSPRLFGRSANDGRKSMVDGVVLDGQTLDLVAARRHESHLFLRYRLPRARAAIREGGAALAGVGIP